MERTVSDNSVATKGRIGSHGVSLNLYPGEKSDFASGSHSAKRKACDEMAEATSAATFGAALNKLIENYYSDVLQQAKWSFISALTASVVAAGFFMGAVCWTMVASGKPQTPQATTQTVQPASASPSLSLIAGVLVEVIAGINFYLYARASRQLAAYHICLERTNRFLLVNALCDDLSEEFKPVMQEKLIEAMINAPMLTIAQATGDGLSKQEQGQAEHSK
ncbi:MAG: hypothetical protein WCA35_06755 [Kovacikia sp.]